MLWADWSVRHVGLTRFIDATHEVVIQQNTYDSVHTNVKVDKAHSTTTKTLQTCIATQRKIINLFVLLRWENKRKPTLSCGHCWAALWGCVIKGHTSPHKLSPWRSCGCCLKWRSCDCENYVTCTCCTTHNIVGPISMPGGFAVRPWTTSWFSSIINALLYNNLTDHI